MKNKIPDGREWEKIVDEAFSSDRIHVFSEEYNTQKRFMRKGVTMKKNNILMNMTVAVATLAVVAFPTAIYLNTRSDETSQLQSAQFAEDTEEATAPPVETINTETYYSLNIGWLPDGMSFQAEDNKASVKSYGYSSDEIKLTVLFLKNTSETPVENICYHDNIVETYSFEENEKRFVMNCNGSYDEETADPKNFGREIFVAFNGTDYMVHIFVTDDVSEDDLKNILNGLSLSVSDTETAREYTPNENELVKDGEDDGQVNGEVHQFTKDDIDYDTIYDVEYGWLPKGLEYQGQDSPYGGKFHNWTTDDGMTPDFTKVQKGSEYYEDTGNPEIATTKDELLLDGKTVSMYYRSTYIPDNPEHNFGRIAFIYFDNTPYVLKLYVTDGISEEDFRKIIDNVKLVPSEEETAGIYTPRQYEQENTAFTVGSYADVGILVEESNIVQVGEEVREKNPDVWGDISATITGVRFADDFNGLTTDQIGNHTDFSKYLNEDGTLAENLRKWVKFENGTEIEFGTETVPFSVMTVSVTYTNNGTTPTGFGGYCICPTLQTQCDGYFFGVYDYNVMEMETQLEETMINFIDNMPCGGAFSFSSPNQEGKNEIHLDAGESTEVTLAFIVEDKFRDNLYLCMNNNGFVDLSNLK